MNSFIMNSFYNFILICYLSDKQPGVRPIGVGKTGGSVTSKNIVGHQREEYGI